MEVICVKGVNIIKTVGTYVVVAAASVAGAALWTNVLEEKYQRFTARIARPKSEKIIDFEKAKKRLSHS